MKKQVLLFVINLLFFYKIVVGQPTEIKSFPTDNIDLLTDVNGTLYFVLQRNGQLWKSNGTAASTIMLFSNGSNLGNLININGTLYFTAYNESIHEASLWKSNGTQAGTVQVFKFSSTFAGITKPVNIGSTIYFGHQDKLYKTDGTEVGTALVKELYPQDNNSRSLSLFAFQNKIFIFLGGFFSQGQPDELWQSNGTNAGTSFIRTFVDAAFLKNAGNFLYMVANDGNTGNELWKSDINGNVSIVKDINPGAEGAFLNTDPFLNYAAAFNNQLFFSTQFPSGLWKTDGTAVGTTQLRSLEYVSGIEAASNTVYFISSEGFGKTNGTIQSTVIIKAFPNSLNDLTLTLVGTQIFFGENNNALWQSDGTSDATVKIAEYGTPEISINSGGFELESVGGTLYFINFIDDSSNPEFPFSYTNLYTYDVNQVWIPTFTIVNSDTDKDIRYLKEGDTLYTDQKITIRADAPSSVSSVKFYLNDVLRRTESSRPFALAGDFSGNYTEWQKQKGKYKITGTPLSSSGSTGKSLIMNFIVLNPQDTIRTTHPQITFTLVNAMTDQDIGPLVNNQVINLSQTGNKLNIRANSTLAGTKSVVFDFNNTSKFRVENAAPYSLFGDNNGNYNIWSPTAGTYMLTATPYLGTGGTGTSGVPLSITFFITGTAAKISMYPNPATDGLTITMEEEESTVVNICIVDESGKEYYKGIHSGSLMKNGLDINLTGSDMKPGIYFVKVQNDTEMQVYKIIKK